MRSVTFYATSVLLFSLALPASITAQEPQPKPDTEKKPKITLADAKVLKDAIGNGGQSAADMLAMVEETVASNPMLDAEFVTRFKKHFDVEAVDRALLQLYVDEFSPELRDQCLKFFQGPFGKRWVQLNKEIAPTLSEKGEAVGKEIGDQIIAGQPVKPRAKRPASEEGTLAWHLDRVLEVTRQREIAAVSMDRSVEQMRAGGMPEQMIEEFQKHLNGELMIDLLHEELLKKVDRELLDAVSTFHQSEAGKAMLERTLRILPKAIDLAEKAGREAAQKAMRGGE